MRSAIFSVLLVVAAPVQAALVDNGSFTTDTVSGLDWLDLSATLDTPFSDALALNPGWRLASNAEVENLFWQLFPNFSETESDACGEYDTTCGISDSLNPLASPDQHERVENFHSLFGSSPTSAGRGFALGSYYDENNLLRAMGAYDYGSRTIVWGLSQTSIVDPDSYAPALGTYLVRSSVVPIPAAAWLFGSALAALGWLRRKQQI